MLRMLMTSLLFLVSTTALSQTPGSFEHKTPDGRTVVMKADGTWEYKKETPRPSAKRDVPNTATDDLTPNFSGNDPRTLLVH